MDDKGYYKIMGVSENATSDEIKTAYRRLARKYHPDVSKEPDATEKFKALGEAYEVLKDPEKRKIYDQYRQQQSNPHQHHADQEWASAEQNPWGSDVFSDQEGGDFFEFLFGKKPRHRTDYQASMMISLEDAYHGAVKDFKMGDQTIRVKIPAVFRKVKKYVWLAWVCQEQWVETRGFVCNPAVF